MWVLKYYRYGREYEYEADTKEDALRFGVYGEDDGALSMHSLIDPKGNVDMDGDALSDYYVYGTDPER